ncbi:hypothetical protein [Haloferula sp. BvORR071]|uniref:hypothetical protein n=1 Tax=Haloferula sp. BvORR071 TaxID=1396141 RepID=UPI00054D20F1|nr:hypothetical protein [Haloferula sp. BvORR071]
MERAVAAALLALVLLPTTSPAEDFSLRVADGNRALADEGFFPSPVEALGGVKGGFYFGVEAEATYDSNFFITQDYPESEVTADLTPWITYRTDPEGGALWSFEARYAPTLHTYWNNSYLNGVDHSADMRLKFNGARTNVELFASYDEVSSADRLAGGFIEGSIFNYGIRGSYQVAPRTKLLAAWTASQSDYSSGARSGSDIYTSQISGLWDATERISIGPVLRHTLTRSDTTGERDAIATLVDLRYKWGERFFFDAAAGVEFAKNSRQGGGRDAGFTGGLDVQYVMNERWTWQGGVHYVTVPSPVNLNYMVEDLSFDTSVIRTFERGSLEFGLGFSFSQYEPVGLIAVNREDDDFLHAFVTYRRKIYNDRILWTSTLRVAENNGQKDYSQCQLSTGLSFEY